MPSEYLINIDIYRAFIKMNALDLANHSDQHLHVLFKYTVEGKTMMEENTLYCISCMSLKQLHVE